MTLSCCVCTVSTINVFTACWHFVDSSLTIIQDRNCVTPCSYYLKKEWTHSCSAELVYSALQHLYTPCSSLALRSQSQMSETISEIIFDLDWLISIVYLWQLLDVVVGRDAVECRVFTGRELTQIRMHLKASCSQDWIGFDFLLAAWSAEGGILPLNQRSRGWWS